MKNITIANLITIGYPTIILLGVIRLYFFYQYFGIDIIPYLDFSEILTSFLNKIIVIIFPMAIFLTMSILSKHQAIREGNAEKIKKIFRVKEFKSRIKLYLNLFIYDLLIYFIIVVVGYIIVKLIYGGEYPWWPILYIILGAFASVLLLIVFYEISIFAYRNSFSEFETRRYYLLFIGAIAFSLVALSGHIEAKYLVEQNNKTLSKISLSNSNTLTSNTLSFYIGKTKNYFFYYNCRDKSYQVYPMSNVECMIFNIPKK